MIVVHNVKDNCKNRTWFKYRPPSGSLVRILQSRVTASLRLLSNEVQARDKKFSQFTSATKFPSVSISSSLVEKYLGV